ncbi:hypothetical protein Zmor_028326 [Zophobas morio]|uniref:Uncharacterized protein n=1 Tax=Zophobas morio TaxID=2755281 RepID=A0AA38M2Z8_9CUCU|nr:hypothetical protein Zmor_028326 [Zophobas morio]
MKTRSVTRNLQELAGMTSTGPHHLGFDLRPQEDLHRTPQDLGDRPSCLETAPQAEQPRGEDNPPAHASHQVFANLEDGPPRHPLVATAAALHLGQPKPANGLDEQPRPPAEPHRQDEDDDDDVQRLRLARQTRQWTGPHYVDRPTLESRHSDQERLHRPQAPGRRRQVVDRVKGLPGPRCTNALTMCATKHRDNDHPRQSVATARGIITTQIAPSYKTSAGRET